MDKKKLGKVCISYRTLKADAYTVRLDPEKRNRSFQKESRTYGKLVKELLAPYGGVCIWGGEGKDTKVGRFLMQYKETDWQFLCRVASLLGYAVIPEVRFPGAKLYIGVQETWKAQPLEAAWWYGGLCVAVHRREAGSRREMVDIFHKDWAGGEREQCAGKPYAGLYRTRREIG